MMVSRRRIARNAALMLFLIAACLTWAAPAAADPTERWSAEIAEASLRFGVPADWIRRVMLIESRGETMLGGQPIVSRAGAMGLMQLMPGTWRDMRRLLGLGPNPHDPHDNILAGAAYLRSMYDRFGYPGVFAAYNAGPARYSAHLLTGRALPSETRAYLVRAAGAHQDATRAEVPAPVMLLFAVPPRDAADRTRQADAGTLGSTPLFVPLGSAGRP